MWFANDANDVTFIKEGSQICNATNMLEMLIKCGSDEGRTGIELTLRSAPLDTDNSVRSTVDLLIDRP